jgi:hypothetical protein
VGEVQGPPATTPRVATAGRTRAVCFAYDLLADAVVATTAVGRKRRFETAFFALAGALFFDAETDVFLFAPRERVTPKETLQSNRMEMLRIRIR